MHIRETAQIASLLQPLPNRPFWALECRKILCIVLSETPRRAKIRRQSAAKSMPAMPRDSGFVDRRYDHVCGQRVQIDGLACRAGKHQTIRRTTSQDSVTIQPLSQMRDYRYWRFALPGFGFEQMAPPERL